MKNKYRTWTALLALTLSLPVYATITDTGDVTTNATEISIGSSSIGKRDINNDTDSHINTVIGDTSSGDGELILYNGDYTSTSIVVGNNGDGLIQSNGGGEVTGVYSYIVSDSVIIGNNSTSNGIVDIINGTRMIIGGAAPQLVIGKNGVGSFLAGNEFTTTADSLAVVVGSVSDPNASTTIAELPGSTGVFTMSPLAGFLAGSSMYIGTNAGGTAGGNGTLNLTGSGFGFAGISVGTIYIGVTGTINNDSFDTIYHINGHIDNQGQINLNSLDKQLGMRIGSLTNAGEINGVPQSVSPGSGMFITGDYEQNASGIHNVVVNSFTGFGTGTRVGGRITVAGNVIVDGTINVDFNNDNNYQLNDTFNIITANLNNAVFAPTLTVNFSNLNPALNLLPVVHQTTSGLMVVLESSLDSDNDGLSDYAEIYVYFTDPVNPDTDGDGLSDGDEVNTYLTNPNNIDTDGDSLSDSDEINVFGTNPNSADSDGDGSLDASDCNPNDPTIYPGAPEISNDGIDQDCDGADLTIAITTAIYDANKKTLKVVATSSLGKDALLVLDGYGSLKFSKRRAEWNLKVRKVSLNPGTVTVTGVEGTATTIVMIIN